MGTVSCVIYITLEEGRQFEIDKAIEELATFTDVVSNVQTIKNKRSLALISTNDEDLGYVAVIEKGQRVATGLSRVRFKQVSKIDPIKLKDLPDLVGSRRKKHLIRYVNEKKVHCLQPKTGHILIQKISNISQSNRKCLSDIVKLLSQKTKISTISHAETVVELEKDAVGVALEIFRGDRKGLLENVSQSSNLAPFLQKLSQANLREDTMLLNDQSLFGDWGLVEKHKIGSHVFQKYGERLTVLNVNRTSLEETLGVDLIYYNHKYKSYVMVQYKRMFKEAADAFPCYRPIDSSYKKEIQQMKAFCTSRAQHTIQNVNDFRFFSNPFFFKLCHKIDPNPLEISPVKGIYIPLDYWDLILESPEAKGKKGGVRITHESAVRWLTNLQFTKLVEKGWIGTHHHEEANLSSIVKQGLENNHSVIIALNESVSEDSKFSNLSDDELGSEEDLF